MTEKHTYHICDARPSGGKAGKGRNKTSTVQVLDDTDPDCAILLKSFRFNVGSSESHREAWDKARTYVRQRELGDIEADFEAIADANSYYTGGV